MRQLKVNIDIRNFYFSILTILLLTYIPTGNTFQCPRHTSRHRDVASLSLTSSVVLEAKPVTTSSIYINGLCHVTLSVRKAFKDSLSIFNESSLSGTRKLSQRLRVGFCLENLDTASLGEEVGGVSNNCSGTIFKDGLEANYLVFLVRSESVKEDGTGSIMELVSINPVIVSSKQGLRDAKKYSCAKCGRKPSARLQPEIFSIAVEPKEKLLLNCRTMGNPPPAVEWIRNGDVLDLSDKRYTLKNTKRGSRLRIRKAEKTDCGEYQCRSFNVLGESSSHSVYVTINPDVSCAAQHKHPCSQQNFCLNGGTCWVLTSTETEFCTCSEGFQGERCAEKVWRQPSVGSIGDDSRLLPVSIAALVFGITTIVAMFLLVFYASRKCASASRKKRLSKESIPASKDYLKLITDTSGTLPSANRTQMTYADEPDSSPARNQAVQTVLSLVNGCNSPFIQVQIQSAIIQPSDHMSDTGEQVGFRFDHLGGDQGYQGALRPDHVEGDQRILRLHHVDSVASTGRDRLSAISTTPGVELRDQGLALEEELDYVDSYVVGLASRADQGRRGSQKKAPQRSPLSVLEEPNSAPVEGGKFLNSPGISRDYGIPITVEIPADAEYRYRTDFSNNSTERGLISSPESQKSSNLISRNNNNNGLVNSYVKNSSMRRNVSNPDILESVGKDFTRTSSNDSQQNVVNHGLAAVNQGLPVVNRRDTGKRRSRQGKDPYDSDPEATVV